MSGAKKKFDLTRITALEAEKHAEAFELGMLDLDDVDPGDLDWFEDNDGNLWTNDALESDGHTFFNLSKPKSKPTSSVRITVRG